MMSELNLKPCPFCGSSDLELYSEENDVLGELCWESFILCKDCHAQTSMFATYETKEEAEDDLAKLWNRRV